MKSLQLLFIIFLLFSSCKLKTDLLDSEENCDKSPVLSFPQADGFGKYATGARGVKNPEVYIVNNLNDSGFDSFRDAVSKPGRFVIFKVGGIINLHPR